MEYNELINDFLDGALDSMQEDKFILLLTTSDEFRYEFKKSMALDQSLKADALGISPSAKSTMNVFSGLGFAPPSAVMPLNAVKTGAAASLLTFLGRYSQGLVSGMVTALATALLFLLFYHPGTDRILVNDGLNRTEYAQLHEFNMPVPVINSSESDEVKKSDNGHKSSSGHRINRSLSVEDTQSDNSANIEKPVNVATYREITQEKLLLRDPHVVNIGGRTVNLNSVSLNLPGILSHDGANYNKIGFSLQFLGSQYWGVPGSDLTSSINPRFSNTGIAVIIPIMNRLELTAELRQEFFFQEFSGTDEKGYRVKWSQFPNFMTFDAGLKYIFLTFDNWDSYVQFMAGGNKAGQIGRAGLGLQWAPNSNYKFLVGLEGSVFRYFHDGSPFNSYKIGLNYGILFDL